MMEKLRLPAFKPRRTREEIERDFPWAATGCRGGRKNNIFTSLDLDPDYMERHNQDLQRKYDVIRQNEVRFEELNCEDADFLIVAFGSAARICIKAMEICREQGIKVGLLRPITLWPFPTQAIQARAKQVKNILCMEINAGQMVDDVRLAVEGHCPVHHYGRMGGMVPTPEEIVEQIKAIVE